MRSEGILYELFDAVVTREDVEAIKPSPECHDVLMKRFGVRPEETLVLEDSLIGLDAARNAGVTVGIIDEPHNDAEREELNARADFTFADWPEIEERFLNEMTKGDRP